MLLVKSACVSLKHGTHMCVHMIRMVPPPPHFEQGKILIFQGKLHDSSQPAIVNCQLSTMQELEKFSINTQ